MPGFGSKLLIRAKSFYFFPFLPCILLCFSFNEWAEDSDEDVKRVRQMQQTNGVMTRRPSVQNVLKCKNPFKKRVAGRRS